MFILLSFSDKQLKLYNLGVFNSMTAINSSQVTLEEGNIKIDELLEVIKDDYRSLILHKKPFPRIYLLDNSINPSLYTDHIQQKLKLTLTVKDAFTLLTEDPTGFKSLEICKTLLKPDPIIKSENSLTTNFTEESNLELV